MDEHPSALITEPRAFVEDTDGRVGVHGEAALARGAVWLVQGHYGRGACEDTRGGECGHG